MTIELHTDGTAAAWDTSDTYRTIVETIDDHAMMVIDADGIVRTWNRGAESIFGYTADAIIGRPLALLFTDDDRARGVAEAELREAERNGRTADERWQRRSDGSRFFALGTVTALRRDGRLHAYFKILRDLTQQKRLEEEVRSHRDRLEFAQEASLMGTFEWEIETDREIWNTGMYRVYQIPSGRTIATYREWAQLVHPDDLAMVEKALAEAIAFRLPATFDNRILVPSGVRWVRVSGKAVYDDGRPLRFVGTQQDITDRKATEAALRQANRELEQFASIAAHDLQEPIRMIRSYLALVQKCCQDRLGDRERQWLAHAITGATRAQAMIQSLLELMRVADPAARARDVEVEHVLVEVLDYLRARIDECDARIEYGPMPVVRANHEHLVLVFQNLIGNALKYGREGVRPEIRVEARRSEHGWLFSVADNGVGIARDDRERVFELFHRVAPTTAVAGSGVGLALCRKIVERHGGRIWVESEVGVGSTFLFTLPTTP